jgi:hypothetical protein
MKYVGLIDRMQAACISNCVHLMPAVFRFPAYVLIG